jgi:hypothetical protein
MKTKLSIFVLLIIAMLLTAPAFALFTITVPQNANAMWVETYPSPLSFTTGGGTLPGAKFNITVCMNITQNVFNYQVALHYNRIQLKALRAFPTAPPMSEFMSNGGVSGTTFAKTIDTSFLGNGSILVSETCSAPEFITGPNSGTLFWAEFQIMLAPDKVNTVLTSVIDIASEYLPGGAGNTWVHDQPAPAGTGSYWNVACSNATYTYSWTPPTSKPKLTIEHTATFGPSPITSSATSTVWPITWGPSPPNATGSGFTASIYIKNLDSGWGLWNASFQLTWDKTIVDVLGGAANVTINPSWYYYTVTPGTGNTIIYVQNYTSPPIGASTTLLVANVTFTVMRQGANPPQSTPDNTMLTFSMVDPYYFYDDPSPGGNQPIVADPPINGQVLVYGLISLPIPYLKVVPASTIIGPAPSIGSTFAVKVQVVNMSKYWYDICVQFRLQYDSAVLQFVSASQGGFMTDSKWNLYGTFFYSVNNLADMIFGDHVAVVNLLLPNDTGFWNQTTFPNTIENPAVDPTVATLTFKVLQQNCFGLPNITTYLNIPPFWLPTDEIFIDKDLNYIPSKSCLNGTVTIVSLNMVGRQIDMYGGAVDDGYGVLVGGPYWQFPAPYGGQGPNHWMDIVFPQSWVFLNANVTYNYWPVQSKDVGFEIEGPYTHVNNTGNFTLDYIPMQAYQIWAKFTATTDANGVATYAYRMPWPCDNPDSITGVWRITSTVTVADQVINDTMLFYYERLVQITGVFTDKYSYKHGECVKVTVTYRTHSVEYYPALFATVITDDLGVPFGMALYGTTVGGATFCSWKTGTFNVTICIPKWAYAGNGYVHESVYDKDPTIGGEALAPEYRPDPQINIYPY